MQHGLNTDINKLSQHYEYIFDFNTVESQIAIYNGWSPDAANYPSGEKDKQGIVITVWIYGDVGSLTSPRYQIYFSLNKKIYMRYYFTEAGWNEWVNLLS